MKTITLIPLQDLLVAQPAGVLENLFFLTKKLFSWFYKQSNNLILNSPEEDAAIQIEESTIRYSEIKKLLGLHIDYKLEVDTHVETTCKKPHSQKSQYIFKSNKLYGAS